MLLEILPPSHGGDNGSNNHDIELPMIKFSQVNGYTEVEPGLPPWLLQELRVSGGDSHWGGSVVSRQSHGRRSAVRERVNWKSADLDWLGAPGAQEPRGGGVPSEGHWADLW